ncbi:MAG: alpha/beta hydrolase [Actinomycetota bacterium]|nr:alpha/beta hydrolase [Actinomycetota bacterium]
MPATMMTVDGFPVRVSVAGRDKGPYVVLLGSAQHPVAAYDTLCQRLHTAAVRTVVIGADPRLHPKAVVAILEARDVPWAVLVGDRFGAELAWELAATRPDRFTGLVVIDRGHPRVEDARGVVPAPDCPPVEINTTALFTSSQARAVARNSQRFVHSDYRLVEFATRRNAAMATAQLAAEIVLRTSTW